MNLTYLLKKHSPSRVKKMYHKLKWLIFLYILKINYGIKGIWEEGYNSQFGQDKFLDSFIFKKLQLDLDFLVDVGSNHPVYNNNSYYFEKDIKCICIDPMYRQEDYKVRENTIFYQLAVNKKKGYSSFYRVEKVNGWEDQMSSFVKPEAHFKTIEENVKVERLENILESVISDGDKFGLMIDVEGMEHVVLDTLNILRFRPVFILVETPALNFTLKNKLIGEGYKYLARVGPCDDFFIDCKVLSHLRS